MIGLLSAVLPSVMEVAGRFLPEDKENVRQRSVILKRS